jgi:hypothetical protein
MVLWLGYQTFCRTSWVRFLSEDFFCKKIFSRSKHPASNPARHLQVNSCLGQTWSKLVVFQNFMQLCACLCVSINIKTLVETPRLLDKKWGLLDRLC